MKQFTISNQLTAMPKRLAMVLTILFTLGVGSMWAADTWKLVTDANDLAAGDEVVIVASSAAQALSTTQNGNNRGQATVTKNSTNKTVSWTSSSVQILTLQAGKTIGTFAFQDKDGTDDGYLYAASSSKNYLRTESTLSANSSWNITITSAGVATIKATGTYTNNWLRYNSSSSIFSCYASGQGDVCIYKKEVAAPSHTITAKSNNETYGTVSLSGTTITATPKTGYRVNTTTPYTISPTNSATVTQNGNTFTVTPTANTTITINFEAIPTYTVNWYVNGTPKHTQTDVEGTSLTNIPTPTTADCDNSKVFVGWTTADYSHATTAPTGMITNTSGMTMPEGGEDYYAVFATETTTGGGTATWSAVSSVNDLKAGDIYAISSSTATEGTYLSTYADANNFPTSTTTICKLELGGSSGAWTFKIVDGSYYNNYYLTATNTTVSNYLKAVNTVDNYCKFSISFNSNAAVIKCTGKNSRNILRYNGTNNPPIFSCYSSGQSAVYLQKYSAGSTTTYSDYITTCTTETTYSVELIQPSNGSISANPYENIKEGDIVDLTANPNSGYKLSAWTVVRKDNSQSVTVTNNQFTMPASDVTVSATFVAIPKLATPANLEVTNITCTGATLTWDNVANNNGYTLLVKNTSSGTTFNSSIAKDVTSGSPTLNPGITYTWKVIAKGDGTNYTDSEEADGGSFTTNYKITYNVKGGTWTACEDGCVANDEDFTICSTVPKKTDYNFIGWSTADDETPEYQAEGTIENITANITLYAVWEQKTYTVILSENGTKTTLTPQTSTSYTLPDDLTAGSCQDDTNKELVGWSTVAIPNPGDKPTSNFYELGETVTLTADTTTFCAVFATPGSGGGGAPEETTTTLDFSAQGYTNGQVVTSLTQGDVTITLDKGSNSNDTKYYETGTAVRVYGGGYFTVSVPNESTISNITLVFGSGDGSNTIEASTGSYTSGTWTGSASSVKFSIGGSSGHRRIKTVTVTYATTTQGGGTSYSDYTTSCVALPDPVLSFATEPANPIVFTDAVCGGNSSKQSVTVVGENLRDVVNVSVTGPYKIARTASTALKDFTTSLTLDKTAAGAIHSNYQTVYIISTPPAQSTEATTGTLTFTTTKGNTLIVNLSTPTVTCTQYTLTLVDRGVSTEQPTKYYAGETINEAPADPEGVCTDPIHYVFDGWAKEEVSSDATSYSKVSFPYEVTGNTKFYAVYRYTGDGGEPSNDFVKVTSAKDDWTGDYVIVNEDAKKAIGNAYEENTSSNKTLAAVAVTITDNKVVSPSEDIIWQIRKNGENYTMYNAAAEQYAYVTAADARKAGLSNSPQDMNISWGSDATKTRVYSPDYARCFSYYSSNSEWRTYATSTYSTGTLYCRSLETYLYTTSPACGPHLEITAGKEIYVTGGNAGAARDLVMASQKISYQATRLKTQDGSPEGTAPDVKVATNGITKGGVVTTEVKVTFENTVKELQPDDTYTITGDIVVTYEADANNMKEDIQVQLAVDYPANADARDNFIVHARSLPEKFVIVAKQGDKWYALNADMSGSKAQPANKQIEVDDIENPTMATFAPCNTVYTFEAMPQGAADRISVRFIGMENKYLWSASEGNTGIQNNSKNPAADALAYNWKLYTTDNVTYQVGNGQNTRMLGLNSSLNFGMYDPVSGLVNDIRILPIDALCTYNYAPTNLKVSELKSTSVTLTWDAVAGATKYQYSTNATNWTDCGTEPTVTINGLEGDTEYIYYIRAYHEDDATKECIDYSEISFTTTNCDDVPTNITYTSSSQSITISWEAEAETSTVRLYSDKEGKEEVKSITSSSPCTISDLEKYTTYYVQILAGGTCPSQIIEVSTLIPNINIAEWMTDGILVDVDTDEDVSVIIENEESYGSGTGSEATELFFSKYYEATTNVKLVAIYNGTKNLIDLTDYQIHYGKDSWESQYITLKDFGATKGQIQPGEEIILYSKTDGNTSDESIMDCVHDDYPDGKWVQVTQSNNEGKGHLSFAGDKTIVLKKAGTIIDIIGALDSSGKPTTANAKTQPSWGDANGWTCATGLSIADDTQIGISTNRCLLIRNNTVTSGENAVTSNIDDFVTLCSEWKGAQVPDNNVDNGVAASCENFAYVGTFDYSDYYTKYETVGKEQVFPGGDRKDGTVKITIEGLSNYSCHNIKLNLKIGEDLKLTETTKVPILISDEQTTDTTSNVFVTLKSTLGVTNPQNHEKIPLTNDQLKEKCETCDIVVLANGKLTHGADGINQFRDLTIYPEGTFHNNDSISVDRLLVHAKRDEVGCAIIENEGVTLTTNAIAHTKRIDAQYWYPFSLPYNCNIADITQANGEPLGDYGVHWGIQYYDGKKRQESGTSAGIGQSSNFWTPIYEPTEQLNAYQGYMIALFDAVVNSQTEMRTIYFPPVSEQMYTESGTDSKETTITSWNVNLEAEKRHHGWNFTGSPYISVFNPQATGLSEDFGLFSEVLIVSGHYDQGSNEYLYDDEYVYVSIPSPNGAKYYDQYITSATSLKPFTAYFVQAIDPTSGNDETQTLAYAKAGRELPTSAPRRSSSTRQRVLVELDITAPDGQTDNTGVWVDECYTPTYEIAADLTKMYVADSKPQLYTLDSDNEKMAYNAIPDASAENIPLGLYAPVGGNYTLALNNRVSRLQGAETVELLYNDNVVANLFYEDYVITADKGIVNGYSLRIRRRTMVDSAIDNITGQIMHIINEDGILTIEGIATDAQVSVYDMLGRLVAVQSADGKTNISMPIMTQGVYNVVVGNDYGKTTVKVVLK